MAMTVTPVESFSKIRKKLYENKLKKDLWIKLDLSYVRDEKMYNTYEPLEVRTINYFCNCSLDFTDINLISEVFDRTKRSFILFSKDKININTLNEYLKLEFLRYKEPLNSFKQILDFLIERNIGLIFKDNDFFHEEFSFGVMEDDEIFICYSPWILT